MCVSVADERILREDLAIYIVSQHSGARGEGEGKEGGVKKRWFCCAVVSLTFLLCTIVPLVADENNIGSIG